MKIGITGITGRMGKALALEIINNNLFDMGGALIREGYDEVGMDIGKFLGLKDNTNSFITDSLEQLFDNSDAVIDFSSPELALKCAEMASKKKKILVCGTTGLNEGEMEQMKSYSHNCVIVHSGNMSIGINLLMNLVEETASLLRDDFDTEVLEMHHRNKKDSPSGTALMLGRAIADGKKLNFGEVPRKVREGFADHREENEIGFAVVRGGDVVGEHTVMFLGNGERLELTHKASSRIIFVNGAIRAVIWASGKKSGFYTMRDVLKIQ